MLNSEPFTNATGAPVPDNTNILTAGRRGQSFRDRFKNVLRSRAASVQEILEVVQRDIRLGGHGFDSLKTNVR
jgi:2-hydroxy-3-keto-5-methylthiopentenyl-1-phosphate phosphatase